MKRKHLITVLMWCVATTLCAQTPVEKGLKSINRQAAEAYIGFLADDELQGREAGFHGSRVAARYIASLLKEMGIRPLGESYYQPFDAYRKERQQKGRLEVHPDSIAKLKQVVHQKLSMNNVLGMIPGKKTNEYVIVGAHFDHLGIDPALDGDQIYNGADDNAVANSQGLCGKRTATGTECHFCFLGRRGERASRIEILCAGVSVH